ncbi:MAG: hypothetical protein Q9O62_07035 [Ardenticatenia bacterium]|nr:hypothetical protein [Ardenticatenia bacterium]
MKYKQPLQQEQTVRPSGGNAHRPPVPVGALANRTLSTCRHRVEQEAIMRRFLIIGTLLLSLLMGSVAVAQQGGDGRPVRVLVETEPPANAIVPDETLVTTRLRVLDAAGNPLPGVRAAVHVDTPPRPNIITTDFPFVEDTTLLELETTLPQGELTFQALYPIRGTYTFRTRVTLPDGQVVEARPTLSLRENPDEVRNILVLVGLLFAFGLLSGLIIRLTGRPGAATVTTLVVLMLAGRTVWAHGPSGETTSRQDEPVTVVREANGLRVTATVAPGSGAVGRLNTITLRATVDNGTPARGSVSVDAIHLEDNVPIYRFVLPLEADGTAQVAAQLFDGTDHELRFTLRTDDGRTVAWKIPVAVEGFAPPLTVKLRSLGLLMIPVVVGLAVGLRAGHSITAGRRQPALGAR